MKKEISIVWFRRDLRLLDNPCISNANSNILAIYILDDPAPKVFKIGQSSQLWLSHSLNKLNKSLNQNLNIYKGNTQKVFQALIKKYKVKDVLFNSCYEPWLKKQENQIKKLLIKQNIEVKVFNSSYLWSPIQILKEDKTYYQVFTAYKNKALQIPPRATLKKSPKKHFFKDIKSQGMSLSPQAWHKKIEKTWSIGESAAQKTLQNFLQKKLLGYKINRDFPHKEQNSFLSPHLHFGEISPAQVWQAVKKHRSKKADKEHFLSEVIWREFSCYLMYHFPKLHKENKNPKFNKFAWEKDNKKIQAWQKGKTGYPLVDAGMKELWQTGYMQNRVRMITASFLIKNLNIHWKYGRDWFWDCLVDADLANNSASWQWVAGSGADASPYFRVFNPSTQGEKFDKEGKYVKKYLPELKKLPAKYLFTPWLAPKEVLKKAQVKNYPKPIVDLKVTREQALKHYKKIQT